MSKFCMQCGAQMNDSDSICTSCGANQNDSSPAFTAEPMLETEKKKSSNAVLIAAAALIVVVALLLLKMLFGGSYKQPIDNMCKALETGKGKYLLKCVPEFMIEDEFEDMKKSEIIDELDEEAEDSLKLLEKSMGDDVKVSYKIKDKDKIDKDDLKDKKKYLEKKYDAKIKVQKGYEIEAKLSIEGDDKSISDTVDIEVYKINGKWCILDGNIGGFNSIF